MFQETKKIVLASAIIMMASLTSALAFDLEDFATTYRATRDAFEKSSLSIKEKEATYKQAFKNRMEMELAVRLAEKQISLDQDPNADVLATEAEIIKLNNLKKSAGSCGI